MATAKKQLNSAEIANLWTTYMGDTLSTCVSKYMVAKAEDEQIRAVVQQALILSEKRAQDIAAILEADNLPVPIGFGDADVNVTAPRLFSDAFALYHVLARIRWVITLTSTSLFLAVRPDVRKLFQEAISTSSALNEQATQVSLTKGILTQAPMISVPKIPYIVEKPSYIGSIIGSHRPLHVISATHIFLSILENTIGKVLVMGFSQVASDPEVKKFFLRGAEIGAKHIKVFSSLLSDEDIPTPASPDSMLTTSTVAPFSEKLMMNHIILINQFAIADIGIAAGQSNRADIAAVYVRLAAEVSQYGEDGVNINIKNGWLEAAP